MTLINKYNKPVPRYTSYPTVPYWDTKAPDQDQWLGSLNTRMEENHDVSLYIHLPFCEELCTYCGCNKRITKRHELEAPYIDAVLAEWAIYVRSLHLRPRLKTLADRSFNRISIGVQDFNPAIMRLINRRQTAEDVERTVETTGHASLLTTPSVRLFDISSIQP